MRDRAAKSFTSISANPMLRPPMTKGVGRFEDPVTEG